MPQVKEIIWRFLPHLCVSIIKERLFSIAFAKCGPAEWELLYLLILSQIDHLRSHRQLMLELPLQQDIVQQQPLRDMFLLIGLKLRIEKELLVYGMPCLNDGVRLPLRNAQLIAMMLPEAASW